MSRVHSGAVQTRVAAARLAKTFHLRFVHQFAVNAKTAPPPPYFDATLGQAGSCMRRHPAGIGSAVAALIFSMAKRDVTFFSGTFAIRRL